MLCLAVPGPDADHLHGDGLVWQPDRQPAADVSHWYDINIVTDNYKNDVM